METVSDRTGETDGDSTYPSTVPYEHEADRGADLRLSRMAARIAEGTRAAPSTARRAVCVIVSLPNLISSPGALVNDVARPNAGKPSSGLTWQTVVRFGCASPDAARRVAIGARLVALAALWRLRDRSVLSSLQSQSGASC